MGWILHEISCRSSTDPEGSVRVGFAAAQDLSKATLLGSLRSAALDVVGLSSPSQALAVYVRHEGRHLPSIRSREDLNLRVSLINIRFVANYVTVV